MADCRGPGCPYGLRIEDIDFLRAVVHPEVQYPARRLKTKIPQTPIPVPASLIAECSAHISAHGRNETLPPSTHTGHLARPRRVDQGRRRRRPQRLPDGTETEGR
jgi:hypothetical protein